MTSESSEGGPIWPAQPPSAEPTVAPVPYPQPSTVPAMRASDAEREAIVKKLTDACGEGRLTLEELTSRVDAAYRATTQAELVPLVVDLPSAMPAAAASTDSALQVPQAKKKRRWVVSVMGEHGRKGRWRLSERTVALTVMGETSLDLRQAILESQDVHISMFVLMGEQRVIVPTGVEVEVTGFVFMGEKKVRVDDAPLRPGMPRVHIRANGMMGSVRVETR